MAENKTNKIRSDQTRMRPEEQVKEKSIADVVSRLN